METETAPDRTAAVLEFLVRLGRAYLASGEQTAEVERRLRQTATAFGLKRPRIVAFPTALFVSVLDGNAERVSLGEGPTETLRLDQIANVYRLGEQASRGELEPLAGARELAQILRSNSRFRTVGVVFGNAILASGLSLLLMPTFPNLATAFLLGLAVGILKFISGGKSLMAVPLPVLAAMFVSISIFLAAKSEMPVDPLHSLVAPLVTFLPGGMLSLGMIELAFGDMVSGASRLVTGVVQLLLLSFGLLVGASLVGYHAADLVETRHAVPFANPSVLSWLGVVVFAIGVYIHFSAPPKSLHWMLAVMLVAFAVQQLTANVFGAAASGFFGMLAVTPLSYLIQNQLKGPPAMVTFLPSFWILVPGALSLLTMKYMLSDQYVGMEGLVDAAIAIVSIALGTLVGASIYKTYSDSLLPAYRRMKPLGR
jgi:uncharacterized membrane protein YjjP (DUF1212 family)